MPKQVMLYDFGEILGFAEEHMGMSWNEAHGFLDYGSDFNILPEDGNGTRETYYDEALGAIEDDEANMGAIIVIAFMDHYDIDEITVK